MSEEEKSGSNLTNPDLWIRLVYMLLFWALSWVARVVIAFVSLIQFILVLVSGSGNQNLQNLGWSIARWTEQNYRFLAFDSDEKPYPFQDWPEPEESAEESDSIPVVDDKLP